MIQEDAVPSERYKQQTRNIQIGQSHVLENNIYLRIISSEIEGENWHLKQGLGSSH